MDLRIFSIGEGFRINSVEALSSAITGHWIQPHSYKYIFLSQGGLIMNEDFVMQGQIFMPPGRLTCE
jgi:hypothetical protein